MLLLHAWRNIWRNKRRTIITVASVAFAVFFAVTQRGFHLGSWDMLLESVMHSYTGYVQVHTKDYWKEKTLDYTFEWNDSLKNAIIAKKNVREVVPRIESFALISVGEKTKPVLVAGIEPEIENRFTKLQAKLVAGKMLLPNDSSAVVSQRLAKFLKLKIGDTIVLISQGYHGVSAAGVFPIKGIVRLPSPEWDNQMVYLPLKVAQNFYSAENKLTTLVVDIKDTRKLDKTAISIQKSINTNIYEVMTWKEMLKELYQQYLFDILSGLVLLAILYMVVGFGIFGTVLMMTNERTHEFAVMLAIGMKHSKLRTILISEMFLIAVIGVIAGMVLSIPLLTYYHLHPIEFTGEYAKTMEQYGMEPFMPVLWKAYYIINQGLVIFALTFLAIIYPIYHVRRLNVVKALKS